ncbi:MAG: aminotransferase class I/II-fold pyridoxal phosphate-dependent enzyme [Clostridia bacterium]
MRPIYNALNDEKFKNQIPFHIPGHLRGRGLKDFGFSLNMDVTELYETDDLHAPEGVIKQSMDNAAKVFGSKKAYYLVNGSTCGVQAMVLGFVGEGEKIICDRYAHKSFVSALTLSGAEPVWVTPDIIDDGTMWSGIKVSNIEKAMTENPDAKAVYITAPNYFGIMGDIEEIAKKAHEKGMYLLVDGAHGAHYGLSEHLPPAIIKLGADAVCMSLHKTLPSLTQTAILLTNKKYERVEDALKIVQTSSPSYLFTASCEYAVEFYEKCGKEPWQRLFEVVERYFPEQIKNCEESVKFKDFTRLNIPVSGNSYRVAEILREDYNIGVECCYGGGIVAVLNTFHTEEEIKKLRHAIDSIHIPYSEKLRIAPFEGKKIYSPRQAFFAKKRWIPFLLAAGKVSASGIMVYPPGVYQVLPGEEISDTAVAVINELLKKGAQIPSLFQSNCLIFDE